MVPKGQSMEVGIEKVRSELMVNIYRYDPTRTTVLRNRFATEGRKRFNELIRKIKEAFKKDGLFGFYDLFKDTESISAFVDWITTQADNYIVSNWVNKYVIDSYRRGLLRARNELIKAGYKVPVLTMNDVNMLITSSVHKQAIELLTNQIMSGLKNIVLQMSQQINMVITNGVLSGDSQQLLLRKILAVITGKDAHELGISNIIGKFVPVKKRIETLARTETIRAHHTANINEYENWGVQGVIVVAEWVTAHDEKVCSHCAGMEGKVFTLNQIRSMIPAHPNCRCIALPKIVNK